MPLSMCTLGLSLLTFLVLFLIRLTEENSQIKTLKSSSVWGKVLNFVTLIFLFICLFSFVFYCFSISIFSLGCLVFVLWAWLVARFPVLFVCPMFSGCVCVCMLHAHVRIIVACIRMNMGCARIPRACAHMLVPRYPDLGSFKFYLFYSISSHMFCFCLVYFCMLKLLG